MGFNKRDEFKRIINDVLQKNKGKSKTRILMALNDARPTDLNDQRFIQVWSAEVRRALKAVRDQEANA